jgi:hypothetical protein
MYTASGKVVPIATHRPMRAARRRTCAQHTEQMPPTPSPGINSPHLAHGWLGPSGHGARKFVG